MKVNLDSLNFETDPMMTHKIMLEQSKNPEYAQMLAMNITNNIYNYFSYKVRMAENINIAIKGTTRSGKSTIGISWAKFISSLTGIPFTVWHVCSNESEYIQKVKDTEHTCFNTTFLIDEQKEAKFGAGSFREEMSIMDVQNILAKKCIHTIWIYPQDFISRNSDYGFESYGRDLNYKINRVIVYDVRKSMFGLMKPLGTCIIPKYTEPAYQNIPYEQWSDYRKTNYKERGRDFDSAFEEEYEQKKDVWIGKEQIGQMGYHHEERFRDAVKLGKMEIFQEAGTKSRQRVIARQKFRQYTEAEVDEIVEIARMGISFDDLQNALGNQPDSKKAD